MRYSEHSITYRWQSYFHSSVLWNHQHMYMWRCCLWGYMCHHSGMGLVNKDLQKLEDLKQTKHLPVKQKHNFTLASDPKFEQWNLPFLVTLVTQSHYNIDNTINNNRAYILRNLSCEVFLIHLHWSMEANVDPRSSLVPCQNWLSGHTFSVCESITVLF